MTKYADDPIGADEQLILDASAALLRRVPTDPLLTRDAVAFAASELRASCVGLDARALYVRLRHLAQQRAALDRAYEDVGASRSADTTVSQRTAEFNQAYSEILHGLAAHPYWCCADGRPDVGVACAQLAQRANHRGIDTHRDRARFMPVANPGTLTAAEDAPAPDVETRALLAFLYERVASAHHAKLDRFVLHALFDLPHAQIARRAGMTHDAVRREYVRSQPRVRALLDEWRDVTPMPAPVAQPPQDSAPPAAPPSRPQRVLHPTAADAAALRSSLTRARVERELPGSASHSYLDGAIEKPWGHEHRIYDDALVDLWLLDIAAGQRTSTHVHARKDTLLMCLEGDGVLGTGDGTTIPLTEGTVVHIRQGAAHSSATDGGMRLVELETPRDKFDLIRLDDPYGRQGARYERQDTVARALVPLAALPAGPPRARVRRQSATGRHRFAVETGAQARRRPGDLVFAISLDVVSILRREPTILSEDTLAYAVGDDLHLTIRSDHAR